MSADGAIEIKAQHVRAGGDGRARVRGFVMPQIFI